mmetsp:Transcript_826/g.3017  ORF Transcript_826/g.3017 Transcript_826/m.3017 type:complete len:205 (-) Transcript_826:409-1023(-)
MQGREPVSFLRLVATDTVGTIQALPIVDDRPRQHQLDDQLQPVVRRLRFFSAVIVDALVHVTANLDRGVSALHSPVRTEAVHAPPELGLSIRVAAHEPIAEGVGASNLVVLVGKVLVVARLGANGVVRDEGLLLLRHEDASHQLRPTESIHNRTTNDESDEEAKDTGQHYLFVRPRPILSLVLLRTSCGDRGEAPEARHWIGSA